jgi:hypothetical protein
VSQIEKASIRAAKFGAMFTSFITGGPRSYHWLIEEVTRFSCGIADVLFSSQGGTRPIADKMKVEILMSAARQTGDHSIKFFQNFSPERSERASEDSYRYTNIFVVHGCRQQLISSDSEEWWRQK